ncbi:MAG TPA: cellulase family glycosylhydrolase [Chloroflexia bacterium]|nr:cellulase family glycosylhydrolase [Chloroflexia bacterium]
MKRFKRIVLVCFVLLNLLLTTFTQISTARAATGHFVTVSNNHLELDGKTVVLKGFNFYPRMTPWDTMWSQWDGPQIQSELAQGKLLGANTVRVLVPYGPSYGWNDVSGKVAPQYLDELRQFVQVAGNYGMKVIVTLFDFYADFPSAGTSAEAANLNYLQTIVGALANDDRVLAWDLHNEPDYYDLWAKNHQPEKVLDWLARIHDNLRQIDPNHLITVGGGFYEDMWYSDSQGRSMLSLSDFVSLHSYNALDFGNEVYHLREHTSKPVLLEETGWPTGPLSLDPAFTEAQQEKVYRMAVETVKQQNLAGMVSWMQNDIIPQTLINLDDKQNYYGLIRRNGTLKPAALVFRDGFEAAPLPSTTTSNLPLTSQPVDEGLRPYYFSETDHYVASPIKELWRRAGGEEVFGLPITDAMLVRRGDDGTATGHNALIVQYFERARFEYYPDKIHEPGFGKYSHIFKYFYITDFGALGREMAGPGILNSPRVNRTGVDNPTYRYFDQTGHDLTGSFLAFWLNHYGDKLFGAPISQPLSENGLTVQYFENVRLEYHPELHGQSGEVQVSRLGSAALQAKGLFQNQPADLPAGEFAATAFGQTWTRTDQPVAGGQASRSWLWGPTGFATALEAYKEGEGGQRLVQYFDKSRMELTNPDGDPTSKWTVTNGLLVKELISGNMQVGDNYFEQRQPARVPFAGDPPEVNPNAPTYASLAAVATLAPGQHVATAATGQIVLATLDKNGQTGQIAATDLPSSPVRNATFIADSGHNIPDVFWRYLTQSRGPVIERGSTNPVEGDVVDWLYSVGLPLSEPYWVKTKIGGVERWVLAQAFERRILTYNPANPPAYQVEMGNVGRHYYTWRYLTGDIFGEN